MDQEDDCFGPNLLIPAGSIATLVLPRGRLKCNIVQFVNQPKTHIDHTYRDFSENLGQDDDDDSLQRMDIDRMTFHQRLYLLLSYTSSSSEHQSKFKTDLPTPQQKQQQQQQYQHNRSILWCSHGRAFRIVDRESLDSSGLLRKFFGYSSLRRFEAHLRHHAYKPLTRGLDAGCYYSEFLLRGMPHLLKHSPTCSERYSQLLPDAQHEPDLGKITARYPLPANRPSIVEEARNRLARQGIYISHPVFEQVCTNVRSNRGFGFEPDLNNLAVIASVGSSVSFLSPLDLLNLLLAFNGE